MRGWSGSKPFRFQDSVLKLKLKGNIGALITIRNKSVFIEAPIVRGTSQG